MQTTTSRSTTEPPPQVLWQPNAGRQTRFLSSAVDEVLWGGEAGGGKSAALINTPLRWVDNPLFSALLLRRQSVDLTPLLLKAHREFPQLGATWHGTDKVYTFPSGARVRFAHCQHELDAFNYQGDEFNLVGFDELTHFTKSQYLELSSRIRKGDPTLPSILRCTSNPGGPGHKWVFERWGAWLDPEYVIPGREPRYAADGAKLPPAREGEVLYFAPGPGGEGVERIVEKGTPFSRSRTFIRSVRSECVQLDPEYEATLAQLDPVRRAQLGRGDFLARPGAGKYFKRNWFSALPVCPADIVSRCRYWDRAGTEKTENDASAGVRLAKTKDGLWVVESVRTFRGSPGEVEAAIKQCAILDGLRCPQVLELDPGSAGLAEKRALSLALVGHTFRWAPKRSDKVTAAGPASAQAEAGNFRVLPGAWVEPFFDELEQFPEGDHDDQVDGLSGAFNWLLGKRSGDTALEVAETARGSRSR